MKEDDIIHRPDPTVRTLAEDLAMRESLCPPFALPGHEWIPESLASAIDEQRILRRTDGAMLVQFGPKAESSHASWIPPLEITWDLPPVSFRDAFAQLLSRAKSGEAVAINMLAVVAIDATATLNNLASSKATLPAMRSVAEGFSHWPFLIGASKAFYEDPNSLRARINLGRGTVPNAGPRTDWRLDEPGRIALALLEHVRLARRSANRGHPLFDEARALPELAKVTASKWWSVAKAFVDLSYPGSMLITALDNLAIPASKRRTPGLHRGAIFNLLQKRFRSLTG